MNRPRKPLNYQTYKNAGGKSDVVRFALEKDGINVVFKDHSAYRYTSNVSGPEHLAKMRELALAGKGLGTYIAANVKDNYCKKIR